METLRHDLRFALRLLWKDRTFAATTLLTLAVCIGANAAIFSVVRAVLLRPLPFAEPDRILVLYDAFPGAGVGRAGTSVPNYLDRLSWRDTFDSLALYRFRGFDVGEAGGAERVEASEVTPSFFTVLRVSPAHGRLFTEAEGEADRTPVAVLAAGYAQRLFGGAASAVGRPLRISGQTHTIVGVLPDGFAFLDPDVKIWRPRRFDADERAEDRRYSQNHDAIARLAPGATIVEAQARLDAQTRHNLDAAGRLRSILVNAGYHSRAVPLGDDLVREVKRTLHLLWGGALFVLLVAAANIVNLVLVRASGRLKELATRHALGASHGRMARQLVTETVLLTVSGGALGFALGAWSLRFIPALGVTALPRAQEVAMDWGVAAFTAGLSLALGLIVGAVPLAQLARLRLNLVLQEDSRGATAGRGTSLLRRGLVTAQVMLAFVLLIGAGLLLASYRQVLGVNPGFVATHVQTAQLNPPATRYRERARVTALLDRLLPRLRALPGVEAAGATSSLPMTGGTDSSVIVPEGHAPKAGESVVSPNQVSVTPGYFEAMRVPLERGRFFTDADSASAPAVVIVDHRLARHFWPGENPVGRRVYLPQSPEDVAAPGPTALWLQVVGVVGSVKQQGLVDGEGTRVGAYYLPFAQSDARGIGLALRTSVEAPPITAAMRDAVAAIDPELPLFDAMAMPERVERSLDARRTPMLLALAFGVVALLLASVGLYGVLAYQVAQRTREIGIRMSLGSNAAGILRLVLREGAVLVGCGLAAGLVASLGLRAVLRSQLFGVSALDPTVLAIVTGVLTAAALLACLGPALRAARVNPVVALARR